ncbi:MAG: HSP20 family protein [Rhodothermales bacterium]|jgi:HSP20 family protein
MISPFFTPWGNLTRAWPGLDHLFESTADPQSSGYPKFNACKDGDDITLTAEVPGLEVAALEVHVHNNLLKVRGDLPVREKAENETYHRNERAYGAFSRDVRLPFRADPAKTTAALENGTLRITVHALAEDKPKQIPVAAN